MSEGFGGLCETVRKGSRDTSCASGAPPPIGRMPGHAAAVLPGGSVSGSTSRNVISTPGA